MDPLTIIFGVSALISFFGGAYQFTRSLQEDERQRKLEQQGRDPVSLTEKQIALSEDTANKNFDLQKEQFEYQKELNNTLIQREDTAFQRQIADLKAAGMSPLMIAGNGASATPLTSATAPQKDISGINTAIGNLMGAYNDVFNRRLNKQQFYLNTVANTAQLYTQIAESKLQQKKIQLENDILDLDYKYYKNHPERNLGLTQILANIASGVLQKNGSAIDLLSGNLPSNNPVSNNPGLPSNNPSADKIVEIFKNPRAISGNLNIPLLNKNKVVKTSELKKDTDFLQEQQNKSYKLAINAVETRANKKDEKLLKAINFLWENSTANDYFLDKESFKNKILNDSSYRKNIAKNLKLKPYVNPFEY